MNTDLHPQIKELASTIDTLESSLAPLLSTAVSTSASKLPLLDKAKLYALTTYSIESLLFSYLRLHGQDAKAHPVFAELSRVKTYFGKIQAAENAGAGSNMSKPRKLDTGAAERFIRHGLAGNDRQDSERAASKARETGTDKASASASAPASTSAAAAAAAAAAKRKLADVGKGTHTRFDDEDEDDAKGHHSSDNDDNEYSAAKRQKRLKELHEARERDVIVPTHDLEDTEEEDIYGTMRNDPPNGPEYNPYSDVGEEDDDDDDDDDEDEEEEKGKEGEGEDQQGKNAIVDGVVQGTTATAGKKRKRGNKKKKQRNEEIARMLAQREAAEIRYGSTTEEDNFSDYMPNKKKSAESAEKDGEKEAKPAEEEGEKEPAPAEKKEELKEGHSSVE